MPTWRRGHKDLLCQSGYESRGEMVSSTHRVKYCSPFQVHVFVSRMSKVTLFEGSLYGGHEVKARHQDGLLFNMTDTFAGRGNLEVEMCLVVKLPKRRRWQCSTGGPQMVLSLFMAICGFQPPEPSKFGVPGPLSQQSQEINTVGQQMAGGWINRQICNRTRAENMSDGCPGFQTVAVKHFQCCHCV